MLQLLCFFFNRGDEELRLYEQDEYDELDFRAEDQYWMTDRNLKIEAVHTFTSDASADHRREINNTNVSSEHRFAINKLQR